MPQKRETLRDLLDELGGGPYLIARAKKGPHHDAVHVGRGGQRLQIRRVSPEARGDHIGHMRVRVVARRFVGAPAEL